MPCAAQLTSRLPVVAGYPHDVKGQGICAFVTLMNAVEPGVVDGLIDKRLKR